MARTPRNGVPSSSSRRQQRETTTVSIGNERDEAQKTLLESYMILASELKSRLLKSQDEKDTLIQTHRQELSDVRDSWARSQLRVEESKQTIRTLTKERDELKEGFEVLLQNVEVCNNFSSWPFPRIHLPSVLPESIPPIPSITTTAISTPASGFENRTLIYRLTQERDEARSERDLLVKESAAKFSMLEAQLALREAELLSLQNGNELNRIVCSSRSTELSQVQPLQLSSDDAIRILQYNATKNRTIQVDIKKLRKRLETTRAKPSEAGPSAQPSSPLGISRTPPRSQSTALDEFNVEIQNLASKLDALQLERAKLKQIIAAEGSETVDGAAYETTATKSPRLKPGHPQEACENCARLREENVKLQERVSELQQLFFPSQTPSSASQPVSSQTSSSPLSFAKPSPFLPQSTPPLLQSTPPPLQPTPPSLQPTTPKPPQSPPPFDTQPTGPDNEGELSMELATPLPSTVVLPPSSSRNSSLPSPISLASSKRSSSRSHDSHPSTRRSSPSVSALLSPFATSADPIGVVETTSPPAAVGLLIDLDDTEDSRANAGVDLQSRSLVVLDSEEGEHGRRLGDDKLLHSQFRLSELELAHEAHEVEDNDATVRPGPPASHLRPLLPGSSSPRPSTPGQVVRRLEEAGEDVIDELRDMILELMPDLRRGEGEAESS